MPFHIKKSSDIYHRIKHIVRYFLYSIPHRSSFHPLPLTNLILTIQPVVGGREHIFSIIKYESRSFKV